MFHDLESSFSDFHWISMLRAFIQQ